MGPSLEKPRQGQEANTSLFSVAMLMIHVVLSKFDSLPNIVLQE